MGGSYGPLGASLGPLGASWEPLGASWEPLGDYLGSPGEVFGASLGLLKLLESRLDGLGSHLGGKKGPQR